jgi:enolase-phosphatase E1
MPPAGRRTTPTPARSEATSPSAWGRPISASTNTSALLLDIEGTTTPVSFVYETLFPFARAHLERTLREGAPSAAAADIERLRRQWETDRAQGTQPPPWPAGATDDPVTPAVAYALWLMDRDSKCTALKSLQGRIWEEGYRRGTLRSELFADVPPALARWKAQGRRTFIYSSGSVLAQQLLFEHTPFGDLRPMIAGWFDTRVGAKREAAAYGRIAGEIGLAPAAVLFVSDVAEELDAARQAGMQTLLALRQGARAGAGVDHPVAHDFDRILP